MQAMKALIKSVKLSTLNRYLSKQSTISNHHFKIISDVAVHVEQGSRSHQEDRYAYINELDRYGFAFFGIYDGHGGENISEHARKYLHHHIFGSDGFKSADYATAIREGFYAEDEHTFHEVNQLI